MPLVSAFEGQRRQIWSTYWVPGQPGLHSEPLPQRGEDVTAALFLRLNVLIKLMQPWRIRIQLHGVAAQRLHSCESEHRSQCLYGAFVASYRFPNWKGQFIWIFNLARPQWEIKIISRVIVPWPDMATWPVLRLTSQVPAQLCPATCRERGCVSSLQTAGTPTRIPL